MSEYLDGPANFTSSSTIANTAEDKILPLNSSQTSITQGHRDDQYLIVDDMPYVPSNKITVRNYRLFKAKEQK